MTAGFLNHRAKSNGRGIADISVENLVVGLGDRLGVHVVAVRVGAVTLEAPLGLVVADVETANQLRASLGRTDDVTDERDRRQAAREWDHLETRRRLVEDALRLHDRFPGERRSASA